MPKRHSTTLSENSQNPVFIRTSVNDDYKPEVAIVLPFYNPGSTWLNTFVRHAKILQEELAGDAKLKYIIVNDGSNDAGLDNEVLKLCNEMDNISYVRYDNNEGKGYALREGVRKANCLYTVITDIDFPYSNKNISEIISLLSRGYDVVTGIRDKSYFNNLPFTRKIISKIFIFMNKFFFRLPVYDTQAGIKGFNERGKAVFLETKINRFLADTEFVMRAHKQKLSFSIITVHLRHGVVFSNFGSSVIFTELKNFFELIKLNTGGKL